MTRYRKRLIQQHSAEAQRVQKTLEDAGIKLDSVASDVLGSPVGRCCERSSPANEPPGSSRSWPAGSCATRSLCCALLGRFSAHHALLVGLALEHLEYLERTITSLDGEIDRIMAPFAETGPGLHAITGVGKRAAEFIIAEIGVDMTRLPTPPISPPGPANAPPTTSPPANALSQDQQRQPPARRNPLRMRAWAAAHSRKTYLGARFWHLARHIGKRKTGTATGHNILTIAWHLLSQQVDYHDPGAEHITQRTDPDRRKDHLVKQLQALGYAVNLRPAT